jgi:hypothetical protein
VSIAHEHAHPRALSHSRTTCTPTHRLVCSHIHTDRQTDDTFSHHAWQQNAHMVVRVCVCESEFVHEGLCILPKRMLAPRRRRGESLGEGGSSPPLIAVPCIRRRSVVNIAAALRLDKERERKSKRERECVCVRECTGVRGRTQRHARRRAYKSVWAHSLVRPQRDRRTSINHPNIHTDILHTHA